MGLLKRPLVWASHRKHKSYCTSSCKSLLTRAFLWFGGGRGALLVGFRSFLRCATTTRLPLARGPQLPHRVCKDAHGTNDLSLIRIAQLSEDFAVVRIARSIDRSHLNATKRRKG